MSWVNQAKTPTRSGIEPDSGVLVRYLRGPGPVNNLSKPGFSLTNRTKKRFFLIRKFHGLNTWSKNLPSYFFHIFLHFYRRRLKKNGKWPKLGRANALRASL